MQRPTTSFQKEDTRLAGSRSGSNRRLVFRTCAALHAADPLTSKRVPISTSARKHRSTTSNNAAQCIRDVCCLAAADCFANS